MRIDVIQAMRGDYVDKNYLYIWLFCEEVILLI